MPANTIFSTSCETGLLEHVGAHHQVRVPVAARVRAIGADPTDLGREVEDELRPDMVEEPRGGAHLGQVVVAASSGEGLVPVGLEPLDEARAEESAAAGDERLHATSSGL